LNIIFGVSTLAVHPEMVDFGSEQGLSNFETAGGASATSRISKKREHRHRPEDAVYGWGLVILRMVSGIFSRGKNFQALSAGFHRPFWLYQAYPQFVQSSLEVYKMFQG